MAGRFQTTLALLKPDVAVNPIAVEEIIQRIKDKGLNVLGRKTLRWNAKDSKLFYQQHSSRFFYRRLVEYTTCGPITALILGGESAVSTWRKLMGPTKTFQASLLQPYSLRGEFGLSDTRNSTHGSDSEESALQEIENVFGDAQASEQTSSLSRLPLDSRETWEVLYKNKDRLALEWFLDFDELREYVMPVIKKVLGNSTRPLHVLDIGCGDSLLGPSIAKHFGDPLSVFCVDFSIGALQRLRNKIDSDEAYDKVRNCHRVYADVTQNLPFEHSTISVIVDKGTIDSLLKSPHGLETAERALQNTLQLLSPSGVLLQVTDEAPEVRIDFLQKVANELGGNFRITNQCISSDTKSDYFIYCIFKS